MKYLQTQVFAGNFNTEGDSRQFFFLSQIAYFLVELFVLDMEQGTDIDSVRLLNFLKFDLPPASPLEMEHELRTILGKESGTFIAVSTTFASVANLLRAGWTGLLFDLSTDMQTNYDASKLQVVTVNCENPHAALYTINNALKTMKVDSASLLLLETASCSSFFLETLLGMVRADMIRIVYSSAMPLGLHLEVKITTSFFLRYHIKTHWDFKQF